MNHIIPVATRYQSQLLENVRNMRDTFPGDKAASLSARNIKIIEEIAERTSRIELIVDDACWPLPKYRELLFIR